MKKRIQTWFSQLSKVGKFGVGVGATFAVLTAVGAAAGAPPTTPTVQPKPVVQSQSVATKTETTTQAVPFITSTVQDSTLAQGTSQTTTQGINGVETLTWQVTYKGSQSTSRKLVSDTITTPPVNEVVTEGTYVAPSCSNGSYVNSAGNTVCSPSSSSNGASAQCADGTYSYSQSRRGTCSHHGGVSTWL